jgi:hypothetical protein
MCSERSRRLLHRKADFKESYWSRSTLSEFIIFPHMKLFDASIYAARRQQLMQAVGKGVFFFPGAIEQPMNYKGNPFPFRQDSNFLYYFGFSHPGLSGIIDADQGISILVGHEADMEEVVWMGPKPKMEDRIQWIGAEQTITPDSLASWLSGKQVQYLPPYHASLPRFLAPETSV